MEIVNYGSKTTGDHLLQDIYIYFYLNTKTGRSVTDTPTEINFVNRTTWRDFEQKKYTDKLQFFGCVILALLPRWGGGGRSLGDVEGGPTFFASFWQVSWALETKKRKLKILIWENPWGSGNKMGGRALTDWKIAGCLHNTVMFQKVPSGWKYHDYLYPMIAILVKCFYKSEYDYHVIP